MATLKDLLDEQERQKQLLAMMAMGGDERALGNYPPPPAQQPSQGNYSDMFDPSIPLPPAKQYTGNTLADIARNPNPNWSQETKDALARRADLSGTLRVSHNGNDVSGLFGGSGNQPQQPTFRNTLQVGNNAPVDLGQSQPAGLSADWARPVDVMGAKGHWASDNSGRIILRDGRIVDPGRDTGEERKRRLADAEIAKREAEVRQLNAKPQDTDIQKQINLMRMYESIPDPKMKQAFGEKHGFAGKPLVEEKPMTAEQRAKFEEGFANDYQTVAQTIETMSNIKNSIADIKGSKGLGAREGLTGYISPILQGEDARIADNRIATLKGKVTQMGKAMASMAGAIGPMAVQEWKIVSDAVNTIDPTAGNFKEQLANIENQADGAINRIKDKYERQYVDRFEKYPQFKREGDGTKPPSSPPQKPANNPTDDAGYEAWKKRNGKS